MARFSERQGISRPAEIKYREDLPEHLRLAIYKILLEATSGRYLLDRIRHLFDRFGVTPLPLHLGEITFEKGEDDPNSVLVKRFMLGCEWFQIYDLVEDVFDQLDHYEEENPDELRAYPLQRAITDFFAQAGIGWKMEAGQIISRGDESFELAVVVAAAALNDSARPTAAAHLHDALSAISRRPKPDLAGAMYHATGCIEALARDLTGLPKSTFGEILKKRPGLLPPPLDLALSQIWGFSSEQARHVLEGREPKREETVLVIGLVAAVVPYLLQKTADQREK